MRLDAFGFVVSDMDKTLGFYRSLGVEFGERYSALTSTGHHGEVEPFDAFWGQRYATVHDPDGNPVDLFAPLAAAGD